MQYREYRNNRVCRCNGIVLDNGLVCDLYFERSDLRISGTRSVGLHLPSLTL